MWRLQAIGEGALGRATDAPSIVVTCSSISGFAEAVEPSRGRVPDPARAARSLFRKREDLASCYYIPDERVPVTEDTRPMPSPLSHSAVGVAGFFLWRHRGKNRSRPTREEFLGLLAFVGLSILPDLDAGVGIALGNMARYHNNFAGTPGFGLAVALALSTVAWAFRRSAFRPVFSLTFLLYSLHVLMDFFTVGRGVMVFWPISGERIQPPFHLFYGLRWSDGIFSERHLITLASELCFLAVLFFGLRLYVKIDDRRRVFREG